MCACTCSCLPPFSPSLSLICSYFGSGFIQPFARKMNVIIPILSKTLGSVLIQIGLGGSILAHFVCALILLNHFAVLRKSIWAFATRGALLVQRCVQKSYGQRSLEIRYTTSVKQDRPEFLPIESTTESRTWRMPAGCDHKVTTAEMCRCRATVLTLPFPLGGKYVHIHIYTYVRVCLCVYKY